MRACRCSLRVTNARIAFDDILYTLSSVDARARPRDPWKVNACVNPPDPVRLPLPRAWSPPCPKATRVVDSKMFTSVSRAGCCYCCCYCCCCCCCRLQAATCARAQKRISLRRFSVLREILPAPWTPRWNTLGLLAKAPFIIAGKCTILTTARRNSIRTPHVHARDKEREEKHFQATTPRRKVVLISLSIYLYLHLRLSFSLFLTRYT